MMLSNVHSITQVETLLSSELLKQEKQSTILVIFWGKKLIDITLQGQIKKKEQINSSANFMTDDEQEKSLGKIKKSTTN